VTSTSPPMVAAVEGNDQEGSMKLHGSAALSPRQRRRAPSRAATTRRSSPDAPPASASGSLGTTKAPFTQTAANREVGTVLRSVLPLDTARHLY